MAAHPTDAQASMSTNTREPIHAWAGRPIWSAPAPINFAGATARLDPADAAGWVMFRHRFDLAALPAEAGGRATADSRYRLWCNGTEVSHGPGRSDPRCLLVDEFDLRPTLYEGANTLAVLACYYSHAMPWWAPAAPTLALGGGMFCLEATVGEQVIATDESWVCLPVDAMKHLAPTGIGGTAPESVDARDVPADWHSSRFDDSSWATATVIEPRHLGWDGRRTFPAAPYGSLTRRSIPQVLARTLDATVVGAAVTAASSELADPIAQVSADLKAADRTAVLDNKTLPFTVELSATQDAGMLVLDFGEQTAGTIELQIDAAAGTRLDAKASEAVDAKLRPVALGQHAGFRYVARGEHDVFETFDTIGLRYLGLSLRGEGQVTINSARLNERRAHRPDGPSFECSDDLLNDLWISGRRTVDLCSQDAYLDCPSREQRAWTGDAVVHLLVDLTTNADWSLAHHNVELAASARPDGMLPMAWGGDLAHADSAFIPDWALHWVHAAANLVRYSGDEALADRLLPTAWRILHWFDEYERSDGLLHDVTGWVLIDWSAVSTPGCSGALNALYGRALRDLRQLAGQTGNRGIAEWASQRWVRLRKAFQAFLDPERGLYVDHMIDGERQAPTSQHTNAAAIVARLTRGVRDGDLIDRICDRDALVAASWLVPDGPATLPSDTADPGDMYRNSGYLITGPPEPWWDTQHQIVAAQPFFRYVVHDAVAAADRTDMIPGLLRDWAPLLERSPTTLSETWFGGSHCHGWSATPTRDLMQYVLGVTPATPGFRRARVAPSLGPLDFARGSVPTPAGPIEIDVTPDRLLLETPVEADVVFGGLDARFEPGSHELSPGSLSGT